jgi:N,N'-diacetyllegionaminate synthase
VSKTFIIAEAGVNHNGSEELALRLIDAAVLCGADAVKFQTFSADKLVRRGTAKAAYQERTTGAGDQYDMLRQLELPDATYSRLFDYSADKSIEFMSSPFDIESADFLVSIGMRRIKIASGEITNFSFLRLLAQKNLPLILSTGMSTLSEIQEAIEVIRKERNFAGFQAPLNEILTVLHCTSSYPADIGDVNLRAMHTMASATGLPIGYSDHTLGIAVSTAAVALGASVIEKHFTLDKTLVGPDHQASLDVAEFTSLVNNIRAVECALGSDVKRPTESELRTRNLVRRSVTSTRDLEAGKVITADDLCLLRPGTGIAPQKIEEISGRKLKHRVGQGVTLTWNDLE